MSISSISPPRSAAVRAGIGALALGAIIWAPAAGAAENSGVADLVERVSPTVVTVFTTEQVAASQGQQYGLPNGFEQFFKHFGIPGPMPGPMPGPDQSVTRHALGSGFILDSNGYVITNNHVVENATDVQVRLNDNRDLEAKVIGTDPQTDIALLKIKAKGPLPHVTLGNSDNIRVGDDVIAVGNPFGLGGTVTRGIVSAIGRDINAGPYVDFIQTDAAINRGNSGGPLFDMQGMVIGVNSAIYSPNGGSVGVGFAIPSNIVKNVVAQLETKGSVERGWLGVSIQTVTPDIAGAMGLKQPDGALVADVVPDGPSHDALHTGDVILGFDGHPVHESRDLPRLVAATKPGTKVDINILRGGKAETVSVKIGALPEERQAANDNVAPASGKAASSKLGATVAALSEQARRSLGLDDSVQGAVVTSLKADGAAAKAGLSVGDVIVRVGSEDVNGPASLDAALAATKTHDALLLVNRRGNQIFVGVKLAA